MSRSAAVSFVVGAVAMFATSGAQAQSWNPFYGTAPTVMNWTGFYIGGQGTYRWASLDVASPDFPQFGTASLNSNEWMGGIHGGVQQQFGQWVLGVDLSGDWGGNGDSENRNFTINNTTGNGNFGEGVDQIFTATGRLGYAWSNVMLYAKGGYASADVSTEGVVTTTGGLVCDTGCSFSRDGGHGGWTVGGGFAWMFTPHVSLGLDYNYIGLGSETLSLDPGGGDIAVRVEPDNIQTVSARLTFYFNTGPEPVAYAPIK